MKKSKPTRKGTKSQQRKVPKKAPKIPANIQAKALLGKELNIVADVAAPATSSTVARLCNIISGYGYVPNPQPSTVVGPAVPSMGRFTLDVNQEFDRSYVLGVLSAGWTVNQTGYYVDNNP